MKILIKKMIQLTTLFVIVGCSPESPKQVPRSIQTGETVSQKPADLVSFNPKVDILFVIDNSGSMSNTQSNLSQNATIFSNAITANSILDYHIAVTSTDMDNCGRTRGGGACGKTHTPRRWSGRRPSQCRPHGCPGLRRTHARCPGP